MTLYIIKVLNGDTGLMEPVRYYLDRQEAAYDLREMAHERGEENAQCEEVQLSDVPKLMDAARDTLTKIRDMADKVLGNRH